MDTKDNPSTNPPGGQSPKLTPAQRKALEFLGKSDSPAWLSNKTGYGQFSDFIHRNTGLSLIKLGLIEYISSIHGPVQITPAGREALRGAK